MVPPCREPPASGSNRVNSEVTGTTCHQALVVRWLHRGWPVGLCPVGPVASGLPTGQDVLAEPVPISRQGRGALNVSGGL